MDSVPFGIIPTVASVTGIASFWLLFGVVRRKPYSQRAYAEADRQAEAY